MKHIKYFLFFIVLLCLLSACSKGESTLNKKECLPDKKISEIVSKRYSDSQLLTITKLDVTMKELDEQYPIECLRRIGSTYRVSYLGSDSVAVIIFDDCENRILGRFYNLYTTKADYDGLAIGQSLESVKNTDPNGEYMFLYTGSDNAPRKSSHYTKDGYLIEIEYDERNTVINITASLI